MFSLHVLLSHLMLLAGGDCVKAATDLYNAEKQFKEVVYCSCLGRSEFKKFRALTVKVLSRNSSCYEQDSSYVRVESLKHGMDKFLDMVK